MFRCLAKLIFLLLATGVIGVFLLCQWFVSHAGAGRIYDGVSDIPKCDVGIVLGTSEHLGGGGENPYFKKRIEAAAALYKAGKVKLLLLSGDNRRSDYNEPAAMAKALQAHGVPASATAPDYAGLRTLDSIVRSKEVFGLNRFTIISQRSHDERALLIARHYDLDAIAFAAEDVPFRYSVQTHIREWFARIKVILDLYILHTPPRHLGEKIHLRVPNS